MKKLMIAVAIVCAAAMSQAAAVTWSTGNIGFDGKDSKLGGSSAIPLNGRVSAYLFTFDSKDAYDGYTTAAQLFEAAVLTSAADPNYGSNSTLTGATFVDAWNNVESANIPFVDGDADPKTTVYAATIITYDQDGDGSIDYYSANTFTVAVEDKGGAKSTAALAWADGTATTWQTTAVPEPTSGLLLLLGVAGMALRRRRA